MKKTLHPIQVQILKSLYRQKLTTYKLSKKLLKPTPLIQFHVNQLFSKKFLLRKENKERKGWVYYTNKRKVKLTEEKDKDILYIKIS